MPNLQKLRGDFHSNPLVYLVLSQSQGSNNVIPKSFTCVWTMWKQCARTKAGTCRSSIRSRSERHNRHCGPWHGASVHWARIPYCSLGDSRGQRMYRACRAMTNHLAHTAREICGWLDHLTSTVRWLSNKEPTGCAAKPWSLVGVLQWVWPRGVLSRV
jgi:hypothetical protein